MRSSWRWNWLRRHAVDQLASLLTALMAALVLLPLIAILGYLTYRGATALNWSYFTQLPRPVGEAGGGMANAIVGSGLILTIAALLGIPLGMGAGIYLAESSERRLALAVRFAADVLNGVPSIVIGLTAYGLVVLNQHHFSAFAGGVALAIMMVPTIARTSEEALRMVPYSVREAALGVGILEWRTIVSIILPAARSGIITGIMLAFSRVAGETAPLLFTAFGNQFWNFNPSQPTAALPLQIFVYAISPYDEWHRQAWAGALVLIALIATTVMLVRLVGNRGLLRGVA
jgi:phosphate transport system permease protein